MADSVQGEEKQSSCTAWSGEGKALTPSTEINNQLSLPLLNLTSAHSRFWKCLYSPALSPAKVSAAPLAHSTGSQGPQAALQQLPGPHNGRQQLGSAHPGSVVCPWPSPMTLPAARSLARRGSPQRGHICILLPHERKTARRLLWTSRVSSPQRHRCWDKATGCPTQSTGIEHEASSMHMALAVG